MKKQVLTIFMLAAGILHGMPVVASDEKVPETVATAAEDFQIDADTPAHPQPDADADADADADEKDNQKDGQIETEPDPFKADPFAGIPLSRMKLRLNNLENLYFSAMEAADLSEAIVAALSENRFFRRNCEFLSRITRKHPFPVMAAMLIFPEFAGIANELLTSEIRAIIDTAAGELHLGTAERLQQFEKLATMLELSQSIALQQRLVYEKIESLEKELLQAVERRHISGSPAEALKKYHTELRLLTRPFKTNLAGLINQYDHQLKLFSEHLDYLKSSADKLPAIRISSQIARTLNGFGDFRTKLERYYSAAADLPTKLENLKTDFHNRLKAISQRNNRTKAHVEDLIGRFPERDTDLEELPEFTLAEELKTTFSLLQKLALAVKNQTGNEDSQHEHELLEILLKFIDGNPWAKTQSDKEQN